MLRYCSENWETFCQEAIAEKGAVINVHPVDRHTLYCMLDDHHGIDRHGIDRPAQLGKRLEKSVWIKAASVLRQISAY